MRYHQELIQSEAFTADLDPYAEQARSMYPGGRFQRFLRAFDRVFRPGLVVFIDEYHEMVLADREQRRIGDQDELSTSNLSEPDLTGVLPYGGVISE